MKSGLSEFRKAGANVPPYPVIDYPKFVEIFRRGGIKSFGCEGRIVSNGLLEQEYEVGKIFQARQHINIVNTEAFFVTSPRRGEVQKEIMLNVILEPEEWMYKRVCTQIDPHGFGRGWIELTDGGRRFVRYDKDVIQQMYARAEEKWAEDPSLVDRILAKDVGEPMPFFVAELID